MTLKDQIAADIKSAMKAGESQKLLVLRSLTAVINNKTIEKRTKNPSTGSTSSPQPGSGQAGAELTDEEIRQALATEAKKRKESAEAFKTGGRQDLADNELAELAVIQNYLPKQLSKEETEKSVLAILEKLEMKAAASGGVPPDGGKFGPAMKAVMSELRGKADASLITEIIKKRLNERD